MCHCRPNVRTPCCGPNCCKKPGGCNFCRRPRFPEKREPPQLRTLPIVQWKQSLNDGWIGKLTALDGTDYILKVGFKLVTNSWVASLIVNGGLVHMSEHESRNDAQLGARDALRRAIALREGE